MRNLFVLMVVLLISITAQADDSMADLGKTTNTATAPTAAPQELNVVQEVNKFQYGKTSYKYVVGLLGEPTQTQDRGDGTKVIMYAKSSTTTNLALYIPVANVIAGKATVKGYSATMMFDKNDMLIFKAASQY